MNLNAAVRRRLHAEMRDLSAAGSLLEVQHPIPVGSIGLLDVELDGARYTEWFRVARLVAPRSAGEPHQIAIEFLQFALAGDESLRGAVRSRRVGRSPRINLAGPGKLSGNTGRSAARISSRESGSADDSGDFPHEVRDVEERAPVTKVAARLLKGRWRARLVSATHKPQQEKKK